MKHNHVLSNQDEVKAHSCFFALFFFHKRVSSEIVIWLVNQAFFSFTCLFHADAVKSILDRRGFRVFPIITNLT